MHPYLKQVGILPKDLQRRLFVRGKPCSAHLGLSEELGNVFNDKIRCPIDVERNETITHKLPCQYPRILASRSRVLH